MLAFRKQSLDFKHTKFSLKKSLSTCLYHLCKKKFETDLKRPQLLTRKRALPEVCQDFVYRMQNVFFSFVYKLFLGLQAVLYCMQVFRKRNYKLSKKNIYKTIFFNRTYRLFSEYSALLQ